MQGCKVGEAKDAAQETVDSTAKTIVFLAQDVA